MALLECRQVVVWTIPTIALLVSFVWLRRKLRPRDRDPPKENLQIDKKNTSSSSLVEEIEQEISRLEILAEAEATEAKVESTFIGNEDDSGAETWSEQNSLTCPVQDSEVISPESETLEELQDIQEEEDNVSCDLTKEEVAIEPSSTEEEKEVTPGPSTNEEVKKTIEDVLQSDLKESDPPAQIEEESSPRIIDEIPETPEITSTTEPIQDIEPEPLMTKIDASEITTTFPKDKSADTKQEEEPTMEKEVLEKKLADLEIDTIKISCEDGRKNSTERDSAIQSPSEVMLASPSISNFSDAHSEGSSDSGKGHSDGNTSPSRTPAGGSSLAGDSAFSSYEFVIPQIMVGRLIGKHGSFIHDIRTNTHTNIFIKRHPETNKLKICAIEGTEQDIEKAIAKIRQKFPLRRFPKLTLEKVSFVTPPKASLNPEDFHLQLVEGVNNDVIISSLISAAHFFVQQPSHPTYGALCRLNQVMNTVYSSSDAPILETPVKDAICAAPAMGGWYRAQIVEVDEETQTCDIRFLDYGGYLNLEIAGLRQIRCDLLMLPFQAVECYLANVAPASQDGWSEEARLFVQSITQGRLLQAQIYEFTENGTPLVYLYTALDSELILVNEELINRGYGTLLTPPEE